MFAAAQLLSFGMLSITSHLERLCSKHAAFDYNSFEMILKPLVTTAECSLNGFERFLIKLENFVSNFAL